MVERLPPATEIVRLPFDGVPVMPDSAFNGFNTAKLAAVAEVNVGTSVIESYVTPAVMEMLLVTN